MTISATVHSPNSQGQRQGPLSWIVAAALFIFGLSLLFRDVWWPGSARSINDNGDGSIVIALLEHWFRVFSGHFTPWKAPEWFWPAPNPLSFTDTLFLLSLPYSAARALGADWFAAINSVTICLATLGYWGMVLLIHRGGVSPAIGSVFAFIFAFGTVATFKLFHLQTYSIQLAPLIGLMLVSGLRAVGPAMFFWNAAAGILVGLMFFTAAQTPWFLGLEVALAGIFIALFNFRQIMAMQRSTFIRAMQGLATFSAGLFLGLVPFALLYRQSLGLHREWDEVLLYTAYPLDMFNLPSGNLLWSNLLTRLGISGQANRFDLEVALGWTPILAICAFLGFVFFRQLRRLAGPQPWDICVRAILAAAAIAPLVSLRFNWFDLWYYVFRFVPGGYSIRTPFRIELATFALLSFGLALVAGRAYQAANRFKTARLNRGFRGDSGATYGGADRRSALHAQFCRDADLAERSASACVGLPGILLASEQRPGLAGISVGSDAAVSGDRDAYDKRQRQLLPARMEPWCDAAGYLC